MEEAVPAEEGCPSDEGEPGEGSYRGRSKRAALTWTTLLHQGKTMAGLTYDECTSFIASYADLQHAGASFRNQAIEKVLIKTVTGAKRCKTNQVRHTETVIGLRINVV